MYRPSVYERNQFLVDTCEIQTKISKGKNKNGKEIFDWESVKDGISVKLFRTRREIIVDRDELNRKFNVGKKVVNVDYRLWLESTVTINEHANRIFNINGDNQVYKVLLTEYLHKNKGTGDAPLLNLLLGVTV